MRILRARGTGESKRCEKRSIVKVNAGKEENEYRGRVKGEIEQKETKKERDNEGKVLKYR